MTLIKWITILTLFVLTSCQDTMHSSSEDVDQIFVELQVSYDSIQLIPEKGIFVYRNIPFSGTAVDYYPNSELLRRSVTFLKGKKDGTFQLFFPNGELSQEVNYQDGKRNGIAKTWWKNGQLRSESNFRDDKADGIQKQWYKEGMIFKKLHLKDGKEVGLQQAWRKNGELYANYEAKNGRIFGMKKANLCFELSDEELKSNVASVNKNLDKIED